MTQIECNSIYQREDSTIALLYIVYWSNKVNEKEKKTKDVKNYLNIKMQEYQV